VVVFSKFYILTSGLDVNLKVVAEEKNPSTPFSVL
jgi:hypothetical protein